MNVDKMRRQMVRNVSDCVLFELSPEQVMHVLNTGNSESILSPWIERHGKNMSIKHGKNFKSLEVWSIERFDKGLTYGCGPTLWSKS